MTLCDTIVLEGEHHFRRQSVRQIENGAWFYAHPSPPEHKINGRVAFWRGVQVESA